MLSIGALFCAVWIVVPAPHRALALLAVAVSEWSAWLLVAGVMAAGLGAAAGLGEGSSGAAPGWTAFAGWVAVLCGVLTVGIALVPPVQAWPVAAAQGVRLSPLQTVTGSRERSDVSVTTVAYATPRGSTPQQGTQQVPQQALEMDVYRATSSVDVPVGRPGVVVMHGGAWNGGRRSEYPRWNRWLAARGYVVFDVDYRLAPQPNWELATGDVLCAVGTIKAQAVHWGVNPERLALLGRSAGGHLALLAAYAAGADGAPVSASGAVSAVSAGSGAAAVWPSCPVTDAAVRAVVSLYGPADLVWGYEHSANQRVINGRETLRRFLGGTPQSAEEVYRRASPISHVSASTPATLLLHGGRDQFAGMQHSRRLASRLGEEGVPHETVLLPYAQHGFDYVFDGWGEQIAQAAIARFLEAQLRG